MGRQWEFRLLGPLEISYGGALVPIPAAKQRILITALLVDSQHLVTLDRLITCLWEDRPPPSARNTVQNYVLRLRKTLTGDHERTPVLTSTPIGYCLDISKDAIDIARVPTLLRSAQSHIAAGDLASAATVLDHVTDLWRGEPLADVPSDVLRREVRPALAEHYLTAQELRIDVRLRLGRHAELVTDLVDLTSRHPLRERLWAQLMLALYRCGRTAEALDAYQRARTQLAEALGADPGPQLRRLHQQVLSHAPSLTVAADRREPVLPPKADMQANPTRLMPITTLWGDKRGLWDLLSTVNSTNDGYLTRISQHDRCAVDVRRRLRRVTVCQVLRAERDGVDRWLLVYDWEVVTRAAPEITGLRNCRLGRLALDHDEHILVAELLFDRPLNAGETVIMEYQAVNPVSDHGGETDWYFRRLRMPVAQYALEIQFSPGVSPARCQQFSSPFGVAPVVRRQDLRTGPTGGVHAVGLDIGPGLFGVEWGWTTPIPGQPETAGR